MEESFSSFCLNWIEVEDSIWTFFQLFVNFIPSWILLCFTTLTKRSERDRDSTSLSSASDVSFPEQTEAFAFFIVRLLKPAPECRVLEGDAASARLLTSIPPIQDQIWTSACLQWCVQPRRHSILFPIQIPNQPVTSAGWLMKTKVLMTAQTILDN